MNKLETYSDEFLQLQAVSPFTGPSFRIPCNERPTGKKKRGPSGQVIPETFLSERTPYTRVFTTATNSKRVFGLSNKGLWLYTYILHNLEQGKDYVQINIDLYKKRLGVSADNTFLEAKKELITQGFIASTGRYKTVFWINPEIFFPGSRIYKYPSNLDIIPFKPQNASTATASEASTH